MNNVKPLLQVIAFAAFAPLAAAQQQAARPGPSDAAARVPPVKYESAFADHIPYHEQKLAPWREVNDEVARSGGRPGISGGARGEAVPAKPPAHPSDSGAPHR